LKKKLEIEKCNRREELINMKMIKAIVRPEKASEILDELSNAGITSATKISILGRGKQKGLKVGDIYYDEIPKEMIMIVIADDEVELVQSIILKVGKTGKKGSFGDGKIFIIPVEKSITISSGLEEI